MKWVKERFWDFRQGHGIYLTFILSFVDFITITYVLLINSIPELKQVFPNIYLYIACFMIAYPSAAIVIGYKVFRKSQFKTDIEIGVDENPYLYKATEGKEKDLTLPLQIWTIESIIAIKKALGILADSDLKEAQEYIQVCKDLIQGKKLEGK